MSDIKLTGFSHGGGCGCKIAPAVLSEILARMPLGLRHPDLLVGAETADDAAVYRVNDEQAVIATTDFFMPIVDDPYDFGRIAATNALADVYAMGGRPIMALAIVGMPVGRLPTEVIREILAGGASICEEAGIPIAGGHSIDSPEPIYGLAAVGIVHPGRIRRNDQARPGDAIILGKGLGIGVMSAALKKGVLSDALYGAMLASTTQLNRVGTLLAEIPEVHGMTDVTGFGLLGHLLEMCRGAGLGAEIRVDALPMLPGVEALAREGHVTGAGGRNWASYGAEVGLPEGLPEWQKALLTDPQTSGGLLVSCAPEAVDAVLGQFHREGYAYARVIGRFAEGPARVRVDGAR